mmetsp:Transcript_31003/g.46774  ORF Transcript_31003/g.46774 Transcript_31003/m.46774 type:complete len:86 (+) Transcript_31003:63-320(+)
MWIRSEALPSELKIEYPDYHQLSASHPPLPLCLSMLATTSPGMCWQPSPHLLLLLRHSFELGDVGKKWGMGKQPCCLPLCLPVSK